MFCFVQRREWRKSPLDCQLENVVLWAASRNPISSLGCDCWINQMFWKEQWSRSNKDAAIRLFLDDTDFQFPLRSALTDSNLDRLHFLQQTQKKPCNFFDRGNSFEDYLNKFITLHNFPCSRAKLSVQSSWMF